MGGWRLNLSFFKLFVEFAIVEKSEQKERIGGGGAAGMKRRQLLL